MYMTTNSVTELLYRGHHLILPTIYKKNFIFKRDMKSNVVMDNLTESKAFLESAA